jgi:hypothetical protein
MNASWLQDASPVMYRLFRQLGSYPYHTQPAEDTLTFDQMSLAILLLTGRFTYCNGFRPRSLTLEKTPMPKQTLFRLIFQSLTASGTEPSEPHDHNRSISNDADLFDVHTILSTFATRNGRPKPPDYRGFPSSFSNHLDGQLPTSELHVWLRLLHANTVLALIEDNEEEKAYDVEAPTQLLVRHFEEQDQTLLSPSISDRSVLGTLDGAIGYDTFKHAMPTVV